MSAANTQEIEPMITDRTAFAYAGIGARDTPQHVMVSMRNAASAMAHQGVTLRSGGADGADTAFEEGCQSGPKEIFLPWPSFNQSKRTDTGVKGQFPNRALEIAEHFHPAWDRLSDPVRTIMARNCYQLLGGDLQSPSLFVLCWTPGGKVTGGTGQALRIASAFNIPVFNLGNQDIDDIAEGVSELIKSWNQEHIERIGL
jgi:hypothetical protein|tara:strand:+ start:94 stop:693 length:600 start_codon:yes stop_codon:yes gene_type:complete